MRGLLVLLAAQSVPVMPGSPGVPATPITQTQICESTERPPGSAGVLDIRLGEPFAAALARSTYRFRSDLPPTGIHLASDRMDLRFRDGARVLDLTGIGGMHNAMLQVTEDPAGSRIVQIGFNYQGRPLSLTEALDRAVMLRHWFVAAGFRALPVLRGIRDSRGFRVTSAPNALARPRDRAAAEVMLADEALATPEMQLFRLRRRGQEMDVTLVNWRRETAVMTHGASSDFDACHGRELGLQVYLTAD